MRARTWLAMGVACAASVAPAGSIAFADDIGGDIPLDGFRPALDARGFVTVDGGDVLAAGEPSFGLITTWSRGLLDLGDGEARYRVVDMVSPTLVAAIGVPGPVPAELAASLPFGVISADRGPDSDGGTPTEPGDDDDGRRGAQGVGDLGVHLKVRLLERERWLVAVAASLSLPTATARSWLGSGAASAGGRAIVEWRSGRLRLGGNLGLRHRAGGAVTFTDDAITMGVPATGMSVTLGATTIPASAAASWALSPGRIEVIGEVGAQLALRGDYQPVETIAAIRVRLAEASHFTLGVGTGLGGAAGSPEVRAFAAILFEPKAPRVEHVELEDAPPSPEAPRPGDRDDDKIVDTLDACPDDPEDFDDYQDDDGCPDVDNDHDEIVDLDDLCPDDPEDRDGLDDEDGCPERDADRDRVDDVDDRCPLEKEVWNTFEDDDGCKDRGRVAVGETELAVFEEIHFDFDSAVIQERSFDILGVIATTLQLNSDLALIEIGGHTDARGNDDYNLLLSQRRANAVRDHLIEQGVDPDRLAAEGYGETAPKLEGRGAKAWTANRRVEFLILERTPR